MRHALLLLILPWLGCSARELEAGHAADADAATDVAGASLERPRFCEQRGDDAVRDVFCAEEPPAIGGLQDLQALFDVDARAFDPDKRTFGLGFDPTRDVAVLTHSTALSGSRVSPINPRVILLGTSISMTFQRGGQQVELVTHERERNELVFYLLTFEQACSDSEDGCSPGDLYTPKVERDWTRMTLQDDEELRNTPSDCRQCHRRGADSSILLMRELESPWTHFMLPPGFESPSPEENGTALTRDYAQAKGDERYGGVDMRVITPIGAFTLQSVVGVEQPLLFSSTAIESERWPWLPEEGRYVAEVQDSPTWESAYEAFKRGEQLALPYLELRATDPDKQAALAQAYRDYQDGELEAEDLPDLGDIYPDDPQLRARIGLATEPDATPAEALIQACGSCHNDVLDQSISRARFSIALARLNRAEIELAIERIERSRDELGAMPPPEARQLAPDARERLLEYLRSDLDPDAIDPMLERAAMLGMAGGGL